MYCCVPDLHNKPVASTDVAEAVYHPNTAGRDKVIAKAVRQQQMEACVVLSNTLRERAGGDVMVEQAVRGRQAVRVRNEAGMFLQTFFELKKVTCQVADPSATGTGTVG